MNFSPRLRKILLVLLQEDQIISVKKLADEIKVSRRTVQRELENIGSNFTNKYKVSLKTKTGIGIWLEGSKEHKSNLYSILQEEDVIDAGDIEDRRKRLLIEILKDRTLKKLYYYANILEVSEATVSNDMEALESWFQQFGLKLIRKQGYGVELEGSEKNYRLAVRKFIDENIDNNMIRSFSFEKERTIPDIFIENEGQNIYNLLKFDILRQVITCVESIRDRRLTRLTENSYIGLILHIAIAISRILQQEIIEPNDELLHRLIKDEDYDLALKIVNSLEEEFQIELPDIEIAYILLHIKGSKLQRIDEMDIENEYQWKKQELLGFINNMIDTYDEKIAYELKQDQDLIAGLLAHLHPTFIRLKNQMNISNPLLQQIQETYPDIYRKCIKVGELITKCYSFQIPEEEIGFLAMHFGAACVRLENQKESKRKVYIGIVCTSGIGISRLMHIKLKRFLSDKAEIFTYGKEDLTPHELNKIDFLISSIKLDDINADIIQVNPLLKENELERIDAKVRVYAKTPKRMKLENEFANQLKQVDFVVTQIKHILKEFQCMKVSKWIPFDELLVAITERLSPYNDRRLQIQEDIKKRENIASQIIPEYDFALLHCHTKGVTKPNFSVCLTRDLDAFKDPYFQNIHTVIIMLIPEDEHIIENGDIMGHLSGKLIDNNEFLSTIRTGNEDDIRNLISKELKEYFNRYIERV